jgi:hypothetical protein
MKADHSRKERASARGERSGDMNQSEQGAAKADLAPAIDCLTKQICPIVLEERYWCFHYLKRYWRGQVVPCRRAHYQ